MHSENVDDLLSKAESLDLLVSGRFFAYIYETGDERLKEIALKALVRFYNKNMLDFTVYRSAVYFEKEVVEFCKNLMNAKEAFGTFTFGGTESIMLAVLAARNRFLKRRGKDTVPEMVVPFTIHPSFLKSAHYLGLNVKIIDIDEKLKADVESLKSAISEKTALIALSAPNWPYGTVDPVKEISEIAKEKEIPLHVDACLGGFILPFFEKIGEKVEPFDFRLDGVTSISMDVHKYGYSPKGASVVLFRDRELKKESMFVNTSNPGYVFINSAVLSSRSVGSLASAFAVIKYLGEEGYMKLSKDVLDARNALLKGMKKLGFESVAPVESSILSLFNENLDLISFVSAMREYGWHFHLQRGVRKYRIPVNIHFTISPIHGRTVGEFLRDAEKVVERKEKREINLNEIFESVKSGKIDSSLAPILVEMFEEEVANELVKEIVIDFFR
jgi:glutamate/tyrosine decarboxylase-like PLP-dependent enzyme